MNRQVRSWAFVSMGLTIAATQGLLIRLLLVSFSGNELSIGLILGNWMLAEALGSNLGGRFAHRLKNAFKSFIFLQTIFAIMLLLTICACYLVRRLAGAAPGEALGFVPIFWTSLLLLAPLSAVHGAMFSVGCATYNKGATQDRTVVGQLYAYEALGAMVGGVALTFVFIPYFNPVQIGLILTVLDLATALLLLWPIAHLRRLGWPVAMIGLLACTCFYLLLSPQALALHRSLVQLRWQVYNVVYDRDSPYGNVAVTQLLGQYTFLTNGAPVLTTPLPDIATVEETVHLPLLFHPAPRRILVIGGGLGGVLHEFLKYPVESIDYAELDPLIIEAVRSFPTALTKQELQDPRLHVHSVDGRWLLNQLVRQGKAAHSYDVVLVNLPYPSTLELNRFYTAEFFQLLREVLDERGLAIFPLPGSLTYVGPGMCDLNLMLQKGLQAVFPHVYPIPGDTTLWLASPYLPLASVTLQGLLDTWQERSLPTRFITEEHLRVRFDPRRLTWFQDALKTDKPIGFNRDLHPTGVLYGLAFWGEEFAPSSYRLLTSISQVSLWQWCLLAVLLACITGLIYKMQHAKCGTVVPIVVATTGFSGIVCDLMIVFVFQSLYGYMYQYVGLIIAVFMAGLALGSWTTTRGPFIVANGRRALIRSELALIAYWAALPLMLIALSSSTAVLLVILVLLALNALGGWLVGLQFPLSSQLHLAAQGEAGRTAGVLYAADLMGGFLGAVAVGIALLPILGTTGTSLFIIILKVCSLILFITVSRS